MEEFKKIIFSKLRTSQNILDSFQKGSYVVGVGDFPEGTIREWKGKKYIKQGKKWVPYKETTKKDSNKLEGFLEKYYGSRKKHSEDWGRSPLDYKSPTYWTGTAPKISALARFGKIDPNNENVLHIPEVGRGVIKEEGGFWFFHTSDKNKKEYEGYISTSSSHYDQLMDLFDIKLGKGEKSEVERWRELGKDFPKLVKETEKEVKEKVKNEKSTFGEWNFKPGDKFFFDQGEFSFMYKVKGPYGNPDIKHYHVKGYENTVFEFVEKSEGLTWRDNLGRAKKTAPVYKIKVVSGKEPPLGPIYSLGYEGANGFSDVTILK